MTVGAAQDRDSGVEIQILGPVAATVAGAPVRLGPQVRALLAVLAVEAGRVLPVSRLVDLLWGDDAPDGAASTVRTHVMHLRRALEPGRVRRDAARVVVSAPGGYLLRIAPEHLDANRFERLVAAGQRLLRAGRAADAAELLREALALHRGPVLADVAERPFARPVIARHDALREAATLSRIEADLALGGHREIVGELAGALAADPLHEPLRRLLVLALYRSGKLTEAARICQDGVALRYAHGLESGDLRDLQQRLLADSGTMDWIPPQPVRPFQLPPDVPEFTGRTSVVADLGRRLVGDAGGVAILALDGPPGAGKSALATHVAHHQAAHFADGVLYVNLRGARTEPLSPATVLRQFLHALGSPAHHASDHVSVDLDTAVAAYRSLLAGRRVLVVLDNAASAEQVRPLLPTSAGSAALVISRGRLADLDGALPVPLGRLPERAGVALLARFVGPERVAAEAMAAAEVVRWCEGLPLALRIAGARLRGRPGWSLAELADRLADAGRRLDELAVGDLAVRVSFQLSYHALTAPRRRMFRLLGMLDGPDFTAEVAAALTGTDLSTTRSTLEYLVDAQLVESPTPGRYRFHDLMRLFARELAEAEDPASDQTEALRRAFTYYLAMVVRAGDAGGPRRRAPAPAAARQGHRLLRTRGGTQPSGRLPVQ